MKFVKKLKRKDGVSILIPTRLLSFKETCQYLDLSELQLKEAMISTQCISYFKIGENLVYFDVDDLVQWITKNRVKSEAELETERPKQQPNAPLTAASVFGN